MVWCGMVWNIMVRLLGNLIYGEVAGGKESAAVLSSRPLAAKSISFFAVLRLRD